jgi:hypothetical protein
MLVDQDCDSSDDVCTLASDSEDELPEEFQQLAYASLAKSLAKNAVKRGCTQDLDEWAETEPDHDVSMAMVLETAMSAIPALSKEASFQATEVLSVHAEDSALDLQVDEGGDFVFEGCAAGDTMAFDIMGIVLDGAFDQFASKQAHHNSQPVHAPSKESSGSLRNVRNGIKASFGCSQPDMSQNEVHTCSKDGDEVEADVAAKVHRTLSRSLASGELHLEVKSLHRERWQAVQSKARDTLADTARVASVLHAAREESRNAQVPQAAELQVETPTPVRSSRTRRRIIGGVVRSPAGETHGLLSSDASQHLSSTSQARQHSKSEPELKLQKHTAQCYSMDGLVSEEPSRTWSANLAHAFDTSGAAGHQFQITYGKDATLAYAFTVTNVAPSAWKSAVSEFGSPALDRPSSKAGSRLRAASMSAMAMDLGMVEPSCASSPFVSMCNSDNHITSMDTIHMRPSKLFGSPVKLKQAHSGLLPYLHSSKKSPEAIAHTMYMSKTTSKWCGLGLRGSASAVF